MATLATATFAEEDEIEDATFDAGVEPAAAADSSDSEAEPSAKRRRLSQDDRPVSDEVDKIHQTFDEIEAPRKVVQRVKIKRLVKYAGETYEEDVEVDEDAPEAVAYFAARASAPTTASLAAHPASRVDTPIDRNTAQFGQGYERRQAPQPTARPGPKRPKSSLSSMATSMGGKATKINTLEKSKSDWSRYVESNRLEDDLAMGRKDTYTERRAFLERADERREQEAQRHKARRQ